MVKPFSFEELIARIRALGRRVAKAGEFVKYEIDDLVLDVRTRSVTVLGVPVTLTLKEFHLLQFLIKNKDRAVSRESIVSSVWGADADVTMNAVDVYIGYIRKKCGFKRKTADVARPWLSTEQQAADLRRRPEVRTNGLSCRRSAAA